VLLTSSVDVLIFKNPKIKLKARIFAKIQELVQTPN